MILIYDNIDGKTPRKLWTGFRVDYSASIKEVFINFMGALATRIGVHALSLNQAGENEHNLPFWVPSFDGRSRREPFRDKISTTFLAGGHSASPDIYVSPKESLLILFGGAWIWDTIDKSFLLRYFDSTYLHDIADFLASQPQIYDKTGENMICAMARTLVADYLGDQQTGSHQQGIYLIEWLIRSISMNSGSRVHLDPATEKEEEQVHIRDDLPSSQESFKSLIENYDLRIDTETTWYTGVSINFDGQRDNRKANLNRFVHAFSQMPWKKLLHHRNRFHWHRTRICKCTRSWYSGTDSQGC